MLHCLLCDILRRLQCFSSDLLCMVPKIQDLILITAYGENRSKYSITVFNTSDGENLASMALLEAFDSTEPMLNTELRESLNQLVSRQYIPL